MFSLVPAVVVTLAVGKEGISQLLFVSQVVLSLILPFIVFPLIYLTSSKDVMTVCVDDEKNTGGERVSVGEEASYSSLVYFGNGRLMTLVGYLLFAVTLVVNILAVVVLAKGL